MNTFSIAMVGTYKNKDKSKLLKWKTLNFFLLKTAQINKIENVFSWGVIYVFKYISCYTDAMFLQYVSNRSAVLLLNVKHCCYRKYVHKRNKLDISTLRSQSSFIYPKPLASNWQQRRFHYLLITMKRHRTAQSSASPIYRRRNSLS